MYAPYQIVEHIDHGAFGNVSKVFHPEKEKNFAMKVIKLPINTSEDEKLKTLREGEILDKYRHPNIVEFFDSFVVGDG